MNPRNGTDGPPAVDLLTLIADDRQVVSYRPRWNALTGSITATVLLQQLIYRWVQNGRQPFYKFTSACDHPLCRPDDDWCAELGMNRYEFETARKRIAVRTSGDVDPEAIVSYWVTAGHLTWYAINEELLTQRLAEFYPPEQAAVGVQARLPTAEPFAKSANGVSQIDERHSRKSQTPFAKVENGKPEPFAKVENAIREIPKQKNRDNLKDHSEQRSPREDAPATATVARPARARDAAAAVAAVGPYDAILRWINFSDRLTAEEGRALDEATLLGWAYWVKLEQSKPSRPANAVALARSQWRKDLQPPDELLGLARAWLAMPDDRRRALLEAIDFPARYGGAGGAGLDDDFPGLPVTAALQVYRATGGALGPPSLMPAPRPLDEPPAEPPPAPAPSANGDSAGSADDGRFWRGVLEDLEGQMTRATYRTWFTGSTARIHGDAVVVGLPSDAAVEWVSHRLHPLVERAVHDHLGERAGRPVSIIYESV